MSRIKKSDENEETYIVKTYRISGLYYDKIYSTHIFTNSDNIVIYKDTSFAELSEELVHNLSQDIIPSSDLVDNIIKSYYNKRTVVWTDPNIDDKNKEFSLWIVDSVNGKIIKDLSDFRKKINKPRNNIKFYLNGNREIEHNIFI